MVHGLSSRVAIDEALVSKLLWWSWEEHPYECCGLLFGRDGAITSVRPVRNVADEPRRHFEIDPAELIAAERSSREGGTALIGYFHSHPDGRAEPSPTDAVMACGDDRLWIIVAKQRFSCWRARKNGTLHGRFDPVEIVVGDKAPCQPAVASPLTVVE